MFLCVDDKFTTIDGPFKKTASVISCAATLAISSSGYAEGGVGGVEKVLNHPVNGNPLVNSQKAMENGHRNSGFSH